LRKLVSSPPSLRRGNGNREAYRFTTRSLPELTPYYRAFYDGARKSVPVVHLTSLALAVWFMDDGCKNRRSVYFNTQQFDRASQERLLAMLWDQHGLHATLNRDKTYVRIRIAVRSMERLRQIVAPHSLPDMRYKLPLDA
jgi:hypothetical protein